MIQVGTRLCGLRPLLSCYWVKTAETVTMIFRHLLCGLLFSTQRQQQLWSIMGCTATDHVDGLFYYTASIGVKFRLKLQRKCVCVRVCVCDCLQCSVKLLWNWPKSLSLWWHCSNMDESWCNVFAPLTSSTAEHQQREMKKSDKPHAVCSQDQKIPSFFSYNCTNMKRRKKASHQKKTSAFVSQMSEKIII